MFSGLTVTRAMRMNGVEALKEDMGGGFFLEALFFFLREIKTASGKRVRIESMFALCFFTFGRY